MKFKSQPRVSGMTAVEVLAATMLASLMLASVLGVMGALARDEKALRAGPIAPAWQRMLAEQLLWDLRNSRQLAVSSERIRMTGFAGRDFASGRPTGRPTAVDYYLVEEAGDRWLVRRETHLDARSSDGWRAELVARGIARMELGTNLMDQVAHGSTLPARDLSAIPERVAVRLYAAASAGPLFDKLLVTR